MEDYQRVTDYEATPKPGDRVLLLYSGGLDTSVMLKWLQDKYQVDVYALYVNIGQKSDDIEAIKQKALNLGAKDFIHDNATDWLVNELGSNAIKANADYEDGYHLFCPIGRIAIAESAVMVADRYGINIVAHGATGRGNDQIRFDSYITTLNPSLKILAPVREWNMGRDEEIEYAKENNIPVEQSLAKIYSYDENIWGCSAEGGEIEDFKKIPPLDKILKTMSSPEESKLNVEYATVLFKHGIPIGLIYDHSDIGITSLTNIIQKANKIGAAHGIGITHLIEDRVLGLKVRGIYEEPGPEILIKAHYALEKAVSTRDEIFFKKDIDRQWAQLVYDGKYYTPLRKHLEKFIDSVNEKVTGTVTMRLYRGRAECVAVDSPWCLNNEAAASFMKNNGFNTKASAGFIEHYNYIQKVAYNLEKTNNENK